MESMGTRILVTILVGLVSSICFGQQLQPKIDNQSVVVKIDQQNNSKAGNARTFNIADISRQFPKSSYTPLKTHQSKSASPSVLDGIYKIRFSEPQHIEQLLKRLRAYPNVIYAEPVYLDSPLLVPNDPEANPSTGSQYHLDLVKAYDAWDITTGDTAITIAILDTGVDPNHEDLGNIQYNYDDPVNGIDDDGNGYIDDFAGWDFADEDDDPTADQNDHGSHVAGVSSASTNNATGIAGIGYNSRYVPIKIFLSSSGFASNSYEAIIYAADQGYDVINLSWGSVESFTQYRQDIINYAVLEKDVVVVAAAGNTPDELNFYPASYDNVLSVAASDQTDNKTSFSTYGRHVDLMAPGIDIYSTRDGSYRTDFGTSFASPMVAGAAALLRDLHPNWTARQIMEQIRVTTDNVYAIGSNSAYDSLLGSGRLNIYNALTDSATQSVRLSGLSFSNGIGDYAYFGDTITLSASFTSYLSDIENFTATVYCDSEYVTFVNNQVHLDRIDSMQEITNTSIRFILSEETPGSAPLNFKFEYTADTSYSDFEFDEYSTSPENINFGEGNSQLTVLPNGSLGYDDNDVEDGVGFSYMNDRLLDKIGIIMGLNKDSVLDNSMISYSLTARSFDFQTEQKTKYYKHPAADLFIEGTFNDQASNSAILDLKIDQRFYGWNTGTSSSNIIAEYRISNASSSNYDSLYFGLLSDFDLQDSSTNMVGWENSRKLGFVTDVDSTIYAGIALLTGQDAYFTRSDINGDMGAFLDDSSKFALVSNMDTTALSNANIVQTNAGLIEMLPAGESTKIAFVLSAAPSYSELLLQIDDAINQYNNIANSARITDYIEVCENTNAYLNPRIGTNHNFYTDASLTNLIGAGDSIEVGPITSDSIIYMVNTDSSYQSDVYAFSVIAKSATANFSMSTDTLFIGDTPTNEVTFTDHSPDAISWNWDLGEGTLTNLQHPSNAYNTAGTYTISLAIESSFGCLDTLHQQLFVAERNEQPVINDITICNGASASISATNTSTIAVYQDQDQETLLFEGASFTSGPIDSDTIFYVTNTESGFESLPVTVDVLLDEINVQYRFLPDTTELVETAIVLINESGNSASQEWYIDGQSIGTNASQTFILPNEESFSLMLEVTSPLGCMASVTNQITPVTSPTPTVSNQVVCKNTLVEISPGNGNIFRFYGDEALSQVLSMGNKMVIDSIQSDTTIYVTSMDSLIEGNFAELSISLVDFEVDILTDPDSIILDGPTALTLSSSNSEITDYEWYIDNELVEISDSPVLFFESPDTINITLVAQNEDGCIDQETIVYKILEQEIVTNVAMESSEYLIFPNPTTKYINIAGGYKVLKIVTTTGREKGFNVTDTGVIDLQGFTPGIYFIILMFDGKTSIQKLVVSR